MPRRKASAWSLTSSGEESTRWLRTVLPLFAPNGAYLYAIADTGDAYRWDVRPAPWARAACAIAGRALTRAEWTDALPDRPYTPACRG